MGIRPTHGGKDAPLAPQITPTPDRVPVIFHVIVGLAYLAAHVVNSIPEGTLLAGL
jgi:hypothetical protein